MKVLFICDEYPPGKNGGIGTSVQNLARELVILGHSVCVAGLYSYGYGQANFEEDQGVRVWRRRYGPNLPVHNESKWYSAFEKLPAFIRQWLNGKRAFTGFTNFITELIDKEKIDCIEIADFNNFCNHVGFVVKWPQFKVPLVVKFHGSYTYFCEELNLPPKDSLKEIDMHLYARADAFSSVSTYTALKTKSLFKIQENVRVLYNGITVPKSNLFEARYKETVIFTGSIAAKKGVFPLAKAWNSVHEKFPNAKLLIFGKGKTTEVQALLHPSARKSVQIKGHVQKELLLAELKKATLAVFPSYSETFGLGVVEAMSQACPVIYTKRSCGPEIVSDEQQGLLVDPDDVNALAAQIIRLLEDEPLRTKLGAAGYRSVKSRFNIQDIAQQNISYYQETTVKFKKESRYVG